MPCQSGIETAILPLCLIHLLHQQHRNWKTECAIFLEALAVPRTLDERAGLIGEWSWLAEEARTMKRTPEAFHPFGNCDTLADSPNARS